jgi:two-component system, NarL family, response regulator LiaR
MIRVAIVDDHAVVRQGVRFLLEQQPDIEIVGEGKDGLQAVTLVTDQVPDVLLLDLLMPKKDGITVLREIKHVAPTTQVIVLTSYAEDEQIFEAMKAGAISYLLKDASPRELIEAVHAAAHGEGMLSPRIAARVLRDMHRRSSPLQELTQREREVLTYLARGRSNAEIAGALSIGEGTVKTHVSNILVKLHLTDRTQAAIYALQKRLVPLDEALEKEKDR